VLRTRPPLTGPEASPPRPRPVRLACLIHAASVRSEPESNSPFNRLLPLRAPPAGPAQGRPAAGPGAKEKLSSTRNQRFAPGVLCPPRGPLGCQSAARGPIFAGFFRVTFACVCFFALQHPPSPGVPNAPGPRCQKTVPARLAAAGPAGHKKAQLGPPAFPPVGGGAARKKEPGQN
jgi:hypothetical protein